MSNRLQYEKSPYLLQHRDNPVDWYPWGGEAFTAAEKAEKPIFLSIGYSTCHWCHVMAHESFEDGQVAEALNRAFVSIKVDREERPDIDGAYMAACIAMTGGGGWPLTVLLTPDQKPFWAGTYLPKEALLSLLEQVERLWREDREGLLSAGEALTEHLRQEQSHRPGSVRRELASRAVAQFHRAFDPVWGGFGSAPKFPTPHNLLFLMGYAQRTGDDRAMLMAEVTLEAMYRGGLFDHVGGGFSRYSTDRRWLVPHFEKMLYDNALLLLAYAQAFQQTGKPLYRQAACRTADYVLRELEGPEGGFFCGQDADSEGVEGKYYVFTPEEAGEALEDAQADLFCRRYGVTAQGNFEGSSIPNLIGQPELVNEPEEMASIRETLRRYREGRTTLHKDDKILTAWNGLMIAALARAGMVLQEPRFLAAAQRAARFLGNHLTGADGRLLARWRAGEGAIPGKLEDHAFYAWGLLELYTATFDVEYLEEARRLAQHLLDGFFDREQGGLYPYAADDEQLITRTKEAYDGAMPSGNSAAALVFSRLARLTGETQWADTARLQFAWLAGAAEEQPLGHGFALLALLEELWPSAELVCAAPEVPEDLTAFLSKTNIPGLTVLVKTPENRERLEALAPFTGDYPIPTQGTRYYLCRNGTCKQPVEHLSDLKWEG